MRSRPCTSLLPRPNGLSKFMSGHEYDRTSWLNDETVPLINLGREASQLLHSQQCPYRVRIQGRLATVRTVSVSNLGKTKSSNPISCTRKNCNYVPLSPKGQKNLYDSSEDEEDLDEYIVEDDRQFRGYGIGGVGNIRTSSTTSNVLKSIVL